MDTITVIVNTTQSEQRLRGLLKLLTGDKGHYSYYVSGSLFYITIHYYNTDMFPFDCLKSFLTSITYNPTDSIMIFQGNGRLLADLNHTVDWFHSAASIQKMEALTGETFNLNVPRDNSKLSPWAKVRNKFMRKKQQGK